ncbi:hypothetical protein PRZ48_005193 [Zasmidium cellare]|uniref:Choline monooxygenase, chloroplastic n=1 Tax=Zasmidium cellare TaxID=395010 RepID=A0ABR0ES25_ZASCE|nr:hypothetical protein PRZ48_005193 [Zasmidium cellare]
MSGLLSYLGYGGSTSPTLEDKSSTRALPSNWYTSQEMYELERRAIFSKQWMLTTHKARFTNAGDWLTYEIAGFGFVLVKDRQGNINGFHNVCRHRGFPVVTGEQGTSKIFACKYHGWSYGLNGKLAKAPGYQELSGFEKERNSLFPIHVKIDKKGFVWVNLDGKETPEISWEGRFKGIDEQERYKNLNFDDYVYDHSWNQDGPYNWKILSDNYNECYHCATTHPDIPEVADLHSYSVKTVGNAIIHDGASTEKQIREGLNVAATYFMPNASMNVSPHFFFIQRFVPSGPMQSSMRYEVYRNKHSSDADFTRIDAMYKRIMSEDKFLCDLTQKNLNAGMFINGELHGRMEKGPLYFQNFIREEVMGHWKREQAAKGEIWPARQVMPPTGKGKVSQADIAFCSGLACSPQNQEVLAW